MRSEHFLLPENDWVPNSSRLPVIVHHAVFDEDEKDRAAVFEAMFANHGWPAQWRGGVFDYHHFHSTAHEVLGIAEGHATLVLGGPGGREVTVEAGDTLVLPAGTGHCRIEADADFLVVGGYPAGQDWGICREALSPEARERMDHLSIPDQDPITDAKGGVAALWRAP